MLVLDLLQFVLNAQATGTVCTETTCPASSYDAITAAFATQGYYQQADMLYFLNNTGLSKLAGLIYILAGFAGIVQMVLGAPPRNYVWFFIGPAIYNWLVLTPDTSYGVRWMSYPGATTKAENQREVTRIAFPGLSNNNFILRNNLTVTRDSLPSKPAEVSLFFLWVDIFFSDLTENVINMIGVYNLVGDAPGGASGSGKKNWGVLTDLKWGKIENITAAKLSSGYIRDAFINFLSSECGDVFKAQVDEASWIAASKGNGKNIPSTVLKATYGTTNYDANGYPIAIPANEAGAISLANELTSHAIFLPESMSKLLNSGLFPKDAPSFTNSSEELKKFITDVKTIKQPAINCSVFLQYLVHAFRYETVGIYNQLADGAPGEFADDPDSVIYDLLYGWGIDDINGGAYKGRNNKIDQREHFLMDLIFVHLIRNEMRFAPQLIDSRFTSATSDNENYIKTFARTFGSKTKYAEVYTWALMVPYFQGILLYLLAMSFPFVALMVIIPGWGKGVISWMTFWIWVKTWDIGIAIVKVLERSIWGAVQNNSNATYINTQVVQMSTWRHETITCASPAGGKIGNCLIPKVEFLPGLDTLSDSFKLFDRGLTLAANLDLDLTNSYYIYIMAALYFAVPAVTGQLVLGAKSGATSLVGGALTGVGDKAASAVTSGVGAEYQQAAKTNQASMGQAVAAKENRGNGVVAAAMGQDNARQMSQLGATTKGFTSQSKNTMAAAQSEAAATIGPASGVFNAASQTSRLGNLMKGPPGSSPTPTGNSSSGGSSPSGAGTPHKGTGFSFGATASPMQNGQSNDRAMSGQNGSNPQSSAAAPSSSGNVQKPGANGQSEGSPQALRTGSSSSTGSTAMVGSPTASAAAAGSRTGTMGAPSSSQPGSMPAILSAYSASSSGAAMQSSTASGATFAALGGGASGASTPFSTPGGSVQGSSSASSPFTAIGGSVGGGSSQGGNTPPFKQALSTWGGGAQAVAPKTASKP